MRNKRLLAILIVFVIVVTTAVLSSVVFTVKQIDITFRGGTYAFKDRQDEVKNDIRAALPFVMGNNIFLSVNEERIKNAIHDDPKLLLISFKNVEAHFPNRLEIIVRERFAVFHYVSESGDVAILDGDLRIISNTRPDLPLVEISGNDIPTVPVEGQPFLKVGNYLTDYLPRDADNKSDTTRTDILKIIVPYFQRSQDSREDAVTEFFNAIKFTRIYSDDTKQNELNVLMRQPSQDNGTDNFYIVRIERADYRFIDKLTRAWQGMDETGADTPGTHWIFDCDLNHPDHHTHQGICWAFSPTVATELWNNA